MLTSFEYCYFVLSKFYHHNDIQRKNENQTLSKAKASKLFVSIHSYCKPSLLYNNFIVRPILAFTRKYQQELKHENEALELLLKP